MITHKWVKPVSTVFALLVCFSFITAKAQQGRLLFHHLKLEDGLSELTNPYIYKDSHGFIWISSINGLNRFDGIRIRRYLPDPLDSTSIYGENIQSDFFEENDSGLWFSTYEALNYYDNKHDRFDHFLVRDDNGHPLIGYHAFHFDSAYNLWLIVDENLLYTFNVKSYEFHLVKKLKHTSNRAVAITDDKERVRTVLTFKVNDDGLEKITFSPESEVLTDSVFWDASTLMHISPRKILVEGDSILWIATSEDLIRYRNATGEAFHLKVNNLITIGHYNDSMMLVSIDQEGLWEFHKSSFSFRYLYRPENENPRSLLTNRIDYISKDRDEGIWVSSTGFGLSYAYAVKRKFDLFNPLTIEDRDNSDFSLNGLYQLSSEKIISSTKSGGIFMLDRNCGILKKLQPTDPESAARMELLYGIFPDRQGHLWLSSHNGLSVTNNQLESIDHVNGETIRMLDGVELADGRIFFSGNKEGIFEVVWKNNSFNLERIKPELFAQSYTPMQLDHHGRIWMNEELIHYLVVDPGNYSIIKVLPIDGITGPFIETTDQQFIWVASTSGLYKVDFQTLEIDKLYNEKNGLPSVGLTSMQMDASGNLWFTCRLGLVVFDPETETSFVYGHDDGIPATEFHRYATCRFDDGEMWFGSAAGITKFYPDRIRKLNINAIPQITQLLVNDKIPDTKLICEVSASTNITEIEKLTFSYKENTLTFILNALEYSAPAKNKIRYKLEGVEPDWVTTLSGHEVRYPNLPAQSYTLFVQASNSDGEYSEAIRRLDFEITPPYYETWWFRTLVILASLALVTYIVYLNFSKKLELQGIRLRLYENLHDDVGSRLTAIVLSTENILREDSSNPKLQHISNIAKSIVANMRRLVWAIDPVNDNFNGLVQKIRHDKNFILDENLPFEIEFDPALSHHVIPGEIRYQVLSIVNEALTNISKYANARHVWISFRKKDNLLLMDIRDDGDGFVVGEAANDKVRSSGYGLGNMEKRVRRVKGNIEIQSKPGEGTTIHVSIPLK